MTVWCRARGVLSRTVVGGVMVLPPRGGDPLDLSGPGSELWELLADPTSVADAAAAVHDAYGVAVEVAEPQVAAFFTQLRDVGAVIASDAT